MSARHSLSITIAALGLLATAPQALALSPPAAAIAAQEAREGCESARGKFSAKGAIERDLTGDGQPDLLINHDELTCPGAGGRSGSCGAAACTVKIFVRDGDRLSEALDILSASVAIGAGNRPSIALSRGPNSVALRWNGRAFK